MPVFYAIDPAALDVGDDLVGYLVAAFEGRFADTDDLMRDLGEALLEETERAFETETAPDGTAWAPLSPATLASAFRKRYPGRAATKRVGRGARSGGGEVVETAAFASFQANKRILQDLGRRGGLWDSVTYRVEDGSVTMTSNKPYALAHQKGLGARSGVASGRTFAELPARPFVGVSEEGKGTVEGIVARWVRERMGTP